MTRWVVDEFIPSDARRVQGTAVDHTAWLYNRDRAIFISLNIASVGLSADEARALLDKMVAGMNVP